MSVGGGGGWFTISIIFKSITSTCIECFDHLVMMQM